MNTFYWYDLETFGINTRYDRIAQFAGIRTDESLNQIGEPDMFYCQLPPDYLPSPESCLITGITPQLCQAEGMTEHLFAEKICQILSEPGTCVVGYNSIRFDDECIRSLFYRNLIDPYQREFKNGNSRWDLIDVVRAVYALRPGNIQWPMHEPGRPSFKLEDLSAANHLTHEAAHDALSDVEATIELAKLIQSEQPKLLDYALKLRNKDHTRSLLNWSLQQPVVHVSNKIPADRGCLAVMAPLAMHPTNKNGVICYDLSHDPTDLMNLSVEEIQERIYTPQSELPAEQSRVHLKTVHLNKSPFVAPLNVLKDVDLNRIGLDYAQCKEHLTMLKTSLGLEKKVAAVFDQPFENKTTDVDEMIYQGFFSYQERARLTQIKDAEPENMPWQADDFKDSRAAELIQRFRARNFPESLNDEQRIAWQQSSLNRLTARHGEDWSEWFKNLDELRSKQTSDEAAHILDMVESHVFSLQ